MPYFCTRFYNLQTKYPFMNRLYSLVILILMQWLCCTSVDAQFYSFDDGMPQRREQRKAQPQVTAPKYKGGKDGINKFLEKNFHNPSERTNAEGQIVVAMIIGTKGKVEQAQVVSGVNEQLDAEALRVAKKLKFKPAQQGKKKVRSRFDVVFPIRRGRLSFFNLPTVDV